MLFIAIWPNTPACKSCRAGSGAAWRGVVRGALWQSYVVHAVLQAVFCVAVIAATTRAAPYPGGYAESYVAISHIAPAPIHAEPVHGPVHGPLLYKAAPILVHEPVVRYACDNVLCRWMYLAILLARETFNAKHLEWTPIGFNSLVVDCCLANAKSECA